MALSVAQDIADSARNRTARTAASKHDIVLLSTDPALRAAIQGALGHTATVWCVSNAQHAVGTLLAGRCVVFVADLKLIPQEHAALFARLAEQFPDLVLLAAGGREEERLARSLLSSGLVYRFLHTPVSGARATSFMEAALRRHGELKALQTNMLTTMKIIVGKPRWSIGVTAAIALIAVVAAAAFFHFRSPSAADMHTVAADSSSTASAALEELLGNARAQMAARHFISPDHRGALDLYAAVVQLDSSNAEAQAGLQQAVDAVLADAETSLRSRDVARALDDIAAVKRVRPTHARLPMLESRAAQLSLSKRYPKVKAVAPPKQVTEEGVRG